VLLLSVRTLRRVLHQRFGGLHVLGEAVQLDHIKPALKAPGSKRLKLEYDEPLSNFTVKFNVRRYSSGAPAAATTPFCPCVAAV